MFPNIYRLKKIRKNEKFEKFEKSEKFRGNKLLRMANFKIFRGNKEEKMKVKLFLLFVYFKSISITVLRKSMESQIIE